MIIKNCILVLSLLLLTVGSLQAESEFMEKFDNDYDQLNRDLLNHTGQRAEITDFVYKKDVATLTFEEGTIHLLRYVDDRPTTAIFIGKGHAEVAVPSHAERMTLMAVSGDSTVSQDFETCFIRFADNLDLKLQEQFAFEPKELSWRDYNIGAQKPQGEVFFKPKMFHTYDNYFQLLRSCYERADDGYFYVDFNRYVYTFDPNRPEESVISYEWHGGDLGVFEVCRMQRQERAVYEDLQMSRIEYPTTALDRTGELEIAGLDGKSLDFARIDFRVHVRRDSLRFVSLFLHHNLTLDSLKVDGSAVDFKRRNDFDFIGAILPDYVSVGDTVTFTLFYHGDDFDHLMPWVEDPAPTPHHLTFVTPDGYDYFMPGIGEAVDIGDGDQQIELRSANVYNEIQFVCFASGIDTVSMTSASGSTIDFLDWGLMNKRYSDCYIPDDIYRPSVIDAVDFMVTTFGPRPWSSHFWVSASGRFDMPGILTVPQIACVSEAQASAFGGIDMLTGRAAAGQWFAATLQHMSDRDRWIIEAMPEYANLLYLQAKLGGAAYSNLLNRRDSLYFLEERGENLPLSAGNRVTLTERTNKGLWVFHMLRFLMMDMESLSDRPFRSFLHELSSLAGMQQINTETLMRLAEKHCGQPLDWFARQWIFGTRMPEYNVDYSVLKEGNQWLVKGHVETKDVAADFRMPVAIQVVDGDGKAISFTREDISGLKDSFELGPFDVQPDKIVFGEFYNVLGRINVDKK